MSNWVALDVAIGIVVVFFIISLIASAINETIATALSWRSHYLERWLGNVLAHPNASAAEVEQALNEFYKHPLLAPLLKQPRWWNSAKTAERKPSYIPSSLFTSYLFDKAPAPDKVTSKTIDAMIAGLPNDELKKTINTFRKEVGDDEVALRRRIEKWYDDSMSRVSGWYKRRTQIALAVIGLGLAIVLNADTLQITRTLWSDKTIRAAVVAKAGQITQQTAQPKSLQAVAGQVEQIKALNIPMGWKLKAGDPRDLPHGAGLWAAKVIGILLTMFATMLGAPFWFDLLSRFVKLRGSGNPPPPAATAQT
jgi:hypothetical protein